MARILRRGAAKRDLGLQWVWSAEQGGPELAEEFVQAGQTTLVALANRPELGVQVEVRSPDLDGLRSFPMRAPFQKILLFYLPLNRGIDLIRVLHGSRDLPSLLDTEAPYN